MQYAVIRGVALSIRYIYYMKEAHIQHTNACECVYTCHIDCVFVRHLIYTFVMSFVGHSGLD